MESWGGGIDSQVEAGLHAVRPFGKAAARRRPTSTLLRHVIIAIASVACTLAIVRAIANESAQAISLSSLSFVNSNKQLQGSADSADSRATSNLARYLLLSAVSVCMRMRKPCSQVIFICIMISPLAQISRNFLFLSFPFCEAKGRLLPDFP